MLLDRGASISAGDDLGMTPLHFAVEYNQFEVARLLLERGADVNAVDKSGKTPSWFTKNRKMLDLLSEYGADTTSIDLE